MTRLEAAKFMIVAWVKDWPLRTLLDVVDGQAGLVTEDRIAQLVVAFPFMPTHLHWYISGHGSGTSTRRFVSDAFPRLNDALWDAKDDVHRLAYSGKLADLKARDIKQTTANDKAGIRAMQKAKREMRQVTTSYRASRDAFLSNQRSAWNVCK